MKVSKFLEQTSYVTMSNIKDDDGYIYLTRFNDSYVTRVGMEDDVKFLADREITEELTHGVGFSPKDKKWYGWSHRAIFGFKVGSTCKKGDCHYRGVTVDDEIEDAIRFWSDPGHINVKAERDINNPLLLQVTWEYDETVPNEKLHGKISGCSWTLNPGRGEWTAKTMADAKQMAQDFNEGVS